MLDLVLHGGNVLTQAWTARAQAVGVRDGRIACVGSASDVLSAAGPATKRIDLAGRTTIPGVQRRTRAHFAVLSDDPLAVSPEALSRIKVEMTLVGGRIAYER